MSARILFLESNPQSTARIDLAGELRELEQTIPAARFRDEITLKVAHAARPDDLVLLLRNEHPDIVHFSGHGAAEGILFRREGDGYVAMGGSVLARVLSGRGVRLAVLNACYSATVAEELARVVPAFVGTSTSVDDQAAIVFAKAFYRSLGDGNSVAEAFRDGGDAVVIDRHQDVFVCGGDLTQKFCGLSPPSAREATQTRGAELPSVFGPAALRFVVIAVAADLALGGFARWALPFSSLSFLQFCAIVSPIALAAASLKWLGAVFSRPGGTKS